MFETNANADETVSRRSVLKTTAGLIAGSTALAGLGAGRGAAETEEGLQFEVEEANEDVIIARVRVPEEYTPGDPGSTYVLGVADRFIIDEDEDAVSLPEDTDGLAHPVEVERLDERIYGMYFRTAEVDLSEAEGEEVTLGLGVFPERTVPGDHWDTHAVPQPRIPQAM